MRNDRRPLPGPGLMLTRATLVALAALTALAFFLGFPAAAEEGGATARSANGWHYSAPVDAAVVDPFRLPNGVYRAGNRGLEYGTTGGEPVYAPAPGLVRFVGRVAGRGVLTIEHPDGRLGSLTGMQSVLVRPGQLLLGGELVGRAGPRLHFGVREHGVYLDPAALIGRRTAGRVHARLVPTRRRAGTGP